MAVVFSLLLLSSWTAVTLTFPRHFFDKNILKISSDDSESSGSGPDEFSRGFVKVVQLDHHSFPRSGFFSRGLTRTAPSTGSRKPLPAFLSQGRPGPAAVSRAAVSPLNFLHPKSPVTLEQKKKQGRQMWQTALEKEDKTMPVPISLKDTKQTCSAVAFTQHVTADGCDTVKVQNKFCFGQCSSLFVPSEGEFAALGTGVGTYRRRVPCSRCAPSKAHTVTVPLHCGTRIREKRLLVVEECKCETGSEERNIEGTAPMLL